MSDFLVLNPVAPGWVILILALLSGFFFLWRENKRVSKLKGIRIMAQTMIVISLTGLALRPSIKTEEPLTPLMLLTHGFNKRIADSIISVYPTINIMKTEDIEEFPKADKLVSFEKLAERSNALKFVLGEGLPIPVLDLKAHFNFRFYPCAKPAGITELRIEPFPVYQRSTLKGKFSNTATSSWIKLKGPGHVEDSTELKDAGEFPFSLSFIPKQAGTFKYQLLFVDSTGKEQSEALPLEIHPERKLNIIFLQQYPSSEIRYLKNFLVSRGHGVVLRNQVSKNLFHYEFGNHESQRINHLTHEMLEAFDLLIINGAQLESLELAELKSLEDAIQAGLGLIILFDQPPDGKHWKSFLGIEFDSSGTDTVHLDFYSDRNQPLQTISAEVKTKEFVQSLIETDKKRILAGFQNTGFGKAGFQLIKETYSLILRGQTENYSEIWTPLITRTARSLNVRHKLSIVTPFPLYINEPVEIEVISSDETPIITADNIPVALEEDAVMDDLWHGKIWMDAGWHQLKAQQDSVFLPFYVSESNEWSSLSIANQIRENRSLQTNDLVLPENRYNMKPVSYWIFFGIFLLASGFLWLEPRI